MPIKASIISIGLIIVLLSSCGKYATDHNHDFSGIWSSDTFYAPDYGYDIHNYLEIYDNNGVFGFFCETDCQSCSCIGLHEGKVKINNKRTKLRIGDSDHKTSLLISQEPVLGSDGKWTMILKDVVYYKQ